MKLRNSETVYYVFAEKEQSAWQKLAANASASVDETKEKYQFKWHLAKGEIKINCGPAVIIF